MQSGTDGFAAFRIPHEIILTGPRVPESVCGTLGTLGPLGTLARFRYRPDESVVAGTRQTPSWQGTRLNRLRATHRYSRSPSLGMPGRYSSGATGHNSGNRHDI